MFTPTSFEGQFSQQMGIKYFFVNKKYIFHFSATLSTLSTGLNAGATIFFKSMVPGRFKNEEKMILYMRIFIVIFGAFITCGAFLFKILPGTVIGFAMLILG